MFEVDAAFLLMLRMISIKRVFLNKPCLFKRRCCLNRETIFKLKQGKQYFCRSKCVCSIDVVVQIAKK